MASSWLALLLPLLAAAALYALLTFVLLPLIHRHRSRYDQYAPLGWAGTSISSLRDRISLLVSGWGRRVVRAEGDGDSDEAGDEMFDFTPPATREERV